MTLGGATTVRPAIAGRLGLALVLMLATNVAAVPAQVNESLRIVFARAEALVRGGDLERALPLLTRVIDGVAAEGSTLADADRLLLQRSLLYRALARWGKSNSDVNADLDRLVELDPRWEPGEAQAPEAMVARFNERRAAKVGYLRITLSPPDAQVKVDGQPVLPLPDLLPVLAGEHVVAAELPGYAPARAEVRVRAERTEGVGLELQRASATIRLATIPAGATVAVDGDVVGRSVAAGDEDDQGASAPVLVAGLLPGWHEVQVTLPDHRPYRQRLELPNLGDFDLGVVRMERAVGVVVLRDLPAAATVRIDGVAREVERQVSSTGEPLREGPGRLVLPVGAHEVFVTGAGGGVYEATVVVPDGETASLDVRVRPGLAFLGVVGGDEFDADGVRAELGGGLSGLEDWFVLDRARDAVMLLSQGGIDLTPLRVADERGSGVRWERVQAASTSAVPAGVFLLAVLPREQPASYYDAWIWAAAPGPPAATRRRIPMGDQDALDSLLEEFRSPMPAPLPWLGAVLVDGLPGTGPAVIEVDPSGPARRAGLQTGDRVEAVDGVPVASVAEFRRLLDAAPEYGGVAVQLRRTGTAMNLRLTLGSSPSVPGLVDATLDPVEWSALASGIAAGTWETPVWALELGQARLLMRAGEYAAAADLLRRIEAPEGAPLGRGAVDYWLGLALLSAPDPDLEGARAALQRAAEDPHARLLNNDGPRVQPRARARLAALAARMATAS